jgi:leucyl/phenylalanyl-tRNA--protein transferase
LVAVDGRVDADSLYKAYSHGIFPWPHGDQEELWFSPIWRGVIDFDRFHVSRSLARALKKCDYEFTIDRAFREVMRNCAEAPRAGQTGTWITDSLLDAYAELHRRGHAHSLEAWRGEELIAGIYGVFAGGSFSAESMFGRESNSSKMCLVRLVEWLKARGLSFLDVQMMTPVTKSFGARYIRRLEFLKRLEKLSRHPPTLDSTTGGRRL